MNQDEKIEFERGEEIARVLMLKRDPEHKDRWQTTHGSKTSIGLARTMQGILSDAYKGG